MEAPCCVNKSPWQDRRVLVTGCTGALGAAVTRELLDSGAVVVGLVQDRAEGSAFARERDAGRIRFVHGRVEDAGRLHGAMAVNEVSAVFHPSAASGTEAVLRAAGLYHSKVPVVVARPAGELRLVRDDDAQTALLGVARFDELFGGTERRPTDVVGRTVLGLLNGGPAPAGENRTRDFVHVRDAARACLATAVAVGTQQSGTDLTFRSGWQFTEHRMATLVVAVLAGRQLEADPSEPPAQPLGWTPTLSLGAALERTIGGYRNFLLAQLFRARPTEATRKAA